MEIRTLSMTGVREWAMSLPPSPVIRLLFGGDRLSCCDEGVAIEEEGVIVGIATIAPFGEERSKQPTIVAMYILPAYRRRGYGKILLEAAINRCLEREFSKIRVDVMSSHAMRIINSLPAYLHDVLDVHDQGDVMDHFT